MTKIEQIKAKIERRIKENRERYKTTNVVSVNYLIECYYQLLSFIESLEKEQSQWLDEAATKYQLEVDKQWNRGWSDSVEQAYVEGVNDVIGTSIGDAFKAGAKWRDEQIAKIPNNIHEAAVRFAQRGYSPFDDPYEMNHVFENDVACFEAGAKWALEQTKMEE